MPGCPRPRERRWRCHRRERASTADCPLRRHLPTTGTDAAKDDVLPTLLVVGTVDHRQPEDGGAAGEPVLFAVERLIVVRDALQAGAAVRVAIATPRRVLGERDRRLEPSGVEPGEGLVHVLAGEDHRRDLGQRRQDGPHVLGGHRIAVEDRLGAEPANFGGMQMQVVAVAVEMAHGHPGGGLMAPPMHDHDLVAALVEPLDDAAPDEAGAAQHENPHALIIPRSCPPLQGPGCPRDAAAVGPVVPARR